MASTMPSVAEVRLTLIWTETNLALLAEHVPDATPLRALGRDLLYPGFFDSVRSPGPAGAPLALEVPWSGRPELQRFWRSYLDITRGKRLSALAGETAFKALVPFRGRLPCDVTIPGETARVTAEGFYYPHGTALTITIEARWPTAPRPLGRVVDLLQGIVLGRSFLSVAWHPAAALQTRLNPFVTRALSWLRTTALGPGTEPGNASDRPYSVTTFVRLKDIDPTQPISEDIHHALEGVTSWLPNWDINVVPPLADRSATVKPGPRGNVCYVSSHGVAVWYPKTALTDDDDPTLGCYHRNQVLAALQIESIDELLVLLDQHVTDHVLISPSADQCGRFAAGIVGRLYGGTKDTYRSWTSRMHIDQRQFVPAVDKARVRYGRDALR